MSKQVIDKLETRYCDIAPIKSQRIRKELVAQDRVAAGSVHRNDA